MSNIVVCKVGDLDAPAREWVVHVFGRELAEDEQVTVMVFPPGRTPLPTERQTAWERIKHVLDKAGDNMRGIPEEDFEAALDEAMVHIRR